MQRARVGVIGCGKISAAYFKAAKSFGNLEYCCCADRDPAAAQAAAAAYGCDALEPAELLRRPDVSLVLNLTTPQAHVAVNTQALQHGKHVYCEKPLALSVEDARPMLALARERNLRVGCAPDTFLGGGLQTCRKLVDDGWIGRPISGTAVMMAPGHEHWHPNPAFYYQQGGGALFDMGPYYLTALVTLLGPAQAVTAMAGRGFAQRTCTTDARFGERLPVEVNTHTAGVVRFQCGALVTVIMSFDVAKHSCPCLELHGTLGSLSLPDPNRFGGPVRFARRRQDWSEAPLLFGNEENARSIGLADMAQAIQDGRPHRCSGELALHVLEIMCALEQSAAEKREIVLTTTCARPAPLPAGLLPGELA